MSAFALDAEETTLVVDRYRDRLLAGAPPDAEEFLDVIDRLDGDGRWSDVDYADRSFAAWEPSRALHRIAELARAYRKSGHPLRGDDRAKAAALRALDFWLDVEPESDNWWHNDIGAPREMRRVVALAGEWMDESTRGKALDVLGRVESDGTGANLLWTAEIEFLYGCFAGDEERAVAAARRSVDEIRVTTEEGIQPDYSFHQHGPCLQQYHYGHSFVDSVASFAALVRGTGCAFPDEKLDTVAALVLEGHRWLQRGGCVSPAACDRAVSRRGKLRASGEAFDRLAGLVDDRADEIESFAEHVDAGPPAGNSPVDADAVGVETAAGTRGHRHYWRSDCSAHHRSDFFASLKTASERTRNTESINDENLRGRYLTAGALYVTRRGDEYLDVFPLWDWTRVPGVTAYRDPDRLTEPARRPFAGGLAEGGYGVDALDYEVAEGDLAARKAWFFGDGTIACLGAGVGASDGGVHTSIEQRWLDGTVRTGRGDGSLPDDAERTVETTWIHHAGVAYHFPETTAVTVSNREQTGSWHDINRQYDPEPLREPVFSAWIDHGDRPTDEEYAYFVSPGVEPSDAPKLASDRPCEVAVNEPTRQAVRFPGEDLLQAVFYEPGTVGTADGEVTVDAPCLLQLREDESTLTVSGPTRAVDAVTATVDGRDLTVDVPDGPEVAPQATIDY